MSTTIRAEVSKDNQYWIPKHRYYELKHFCMQYPYWHEKIKMINLMPEIKPGNIKEMSPSDPVYAAYEERQKYFALIDIVEGAIFETTGRDDVGACLLQGITTGISYDILEAQNEWMPCSKTEYYDLYRRFFWILDKKRG